MSLVSPNGLSVLTIFQINKNKILLTQKKMFLSRTVRMKREAPIQMIYRIHGAEFVSLYENYLKMLAAQTA